MITNLAWGIQIGDECCHIYSDQSLEELLHWMKKSGLPNRIHASRLLPHFDAFGNYLTYCEKPGVTLEELEKDMNDWRNWIKENRTRIRSSSI